MADSKLCEEKRLNDRRKYHRFETQLEAAYISAESQWGGENCTILDFSRKGMKAKVCTSEEINVGTKVLLEVHIPGELEPINVKGTIKWVKQIESGYISGIELLERLEEIKLSKLLLCTTKNKIEKQDNLKITPIKTVPTGKSLTPKSSKDRFMP